MLELSPLDHFIMKTKSPLLSELKGSIYKIGEVKLQYMYAEK